MATLRDIKLRIKGVKNTQQITKAMKMVAAARLRKAQENIINARPYAKKISLMLSHLATEEDRQNNPFVAKREVKNVGVAVVTADRGLCGAFNTNLIKEASGYLKELEEQNINYSLFCVGKKGSDFFRKRDYDVSNFHTGIFSSLDYSWANQIADELISVYLNGTFEKIVIIFNEFKSIIQQKIVIDEFLPIPVIEESEVDESVEPSFIYEPDQKSIFEYLIPKHLKAQVWRILLESNAAELGARMTAMDNATTNAKEMIRSLNLTYNKERQAAITKEILEIVSGANALKSN